MNIKNEKYDINSMSFEQALEDLENIINNLEKGDISLEESMKIYERGESLKKHCEKLLKRAELKIEKIILNDNGEIKKLQSLIK